MYYNEGTYEFGKSIYLADQRYPRILADENSAFADSIRLISNNDQSYFCLKKIKDEYPQRLWYKSEYGWKEVGQVGDEYLIPTEAFTFTFDPKGFITEGDGIIAFSAQEGDSLSKKNYRELNVHIW